MGVENIVLVEVVDNGFVFDVNKFPELCGVDNPKRPEAFWVTFFIPNKAFAPLAISFPMLDNAPFTSLNILDVEVGRTAWPVAFLPEAKLVRVDVDKSRGLIIPSFIPDVSVLLIKLFELFIKVFAPVPNPKL